jgi:hypothetical protein
MLKLPSFVAWVKQDEEVWQAVTTRVNKSQMADMHECCEEAYLRHSFLSIATIVKCTKSETEMCCKGERLLDA